VRRAFNLPRLADRLLPFLHWRNRVNALSLRADALAGLVGALVVLPQAVAYATLAGLPPQYGLFAAIVPVIVAALWGSSWHQVSGPTNTIALATFAIVAPLAAPGGTEYIKLVLTLALLVGVLQLAMGLARLGVLVNFISQTVIVGFTAGAGMLIIAGQLGHFFGMDVGGKGDFFAMLHAFLRQLARIDPVTTLVGVVTLLATLAGKRWWPRIPYMITGLVLGSVFAWVLVRTGIGSTPMVGALPSAIPQLSLPSFDPADWRRLAPGALALTALALAQAVSVARGVGQRVGQRIDGNQEFVGQGLSNIAGAFTSSFPSSGSFNRIWVNVEAGARTPLAAVFSALFLMLSLLVLAPLADYLPLAVMAALLFVVAWGLIDIREMRRIARTQRAEAVVLIITLVATVTVQLEFAIFVGVLSSLFVYLKRTTHPHVTRVVPDAGVPYLRFVSAEGGAVLPANVDIIRIDGSLFFGAVDHVRDELDRHRAQRSDVANVLLLLSGVNFIDVAGAELLAQQAGALRADGATLWVANLRPPVRAVLADGGFFSAADFEHSFDTEDEAMAAIAARLAIEQVPAEAAAS
jgi:SulP family sulfate permease